MTDIIYGLQGENPKKGIPYVGGRYDLYYMNMYQNFCFRPLIQMHVYVVTGTK